jgi:regulator of sirC expression with transglutaminase-like and TPR domain
LVISLVVIGATGPLVDNKISAAIPLPDDSADASAAFPTVEKLTESVLPSVVVIRVTGRDGKREGLGTGFVVARDGLIATNLHVIGEARPITVQLSNGKRYDVTTVEASDRSLDLALLRIHATDLVPLTLGNSDSLKQGQQVVAVGNPHGLAHSVVAGVVSGKRDFDGRPMIQLAIPVEAGNSGGPLVDMHGRVQGIITMRSVTPNLGFAVAANSLKPLLTKPNPVPMERWLTIGAIDPQQWKPLFGARWRQRGGRIAVTGAGASFGGRSLCLAQRPVPPLPYEVAVTVRLDDESGAAGLIFHADGGDRHYGFYPSSGQLRFTRFDGPDVYSWKILFQESSSHYRPGDWNVLKVRVDKAKIRCFVNNHFVFETNDTALTTGQAGLAKFRDTEAEFKNFQIAKQITSAALAPELVNRVTTSIAALDPREPPQPGLVDSLAGEPPAAVAVLRDRARALEQQADQIRKLAHVVHERRIQKQLARLFDAGEDEIDLIQGALLIAKLDNDDVDLETYRNDVERMARELAADVKPGMKEQAKLAALNKYLFTDHGFHGSRGDYYNRSNSYLNEVLDDREGLPITLSLIYMELGRRIGLRIEGVALPGHFVVRLNPAKGEPQLIDVFEGGKPLSRDDADKRVQASTGRSLTEKDLAAVSKQAILVRMVHNLLGIARNAGDADGTLRYLDTILAMAPDSAEERGVRAILLYQARRHLEALADVNWLLEHKPDGLDTEKLLEFRRALEKESKK